MTKQPVRTKGGRGARQRILDAAAELFYREGINATGVERLAAESSVSKRTLYQHFPSKTAVVEEYLRSIEQRVADSVQPLADAGDRLGVLRVAAGAEDFEALCRERARDRVTYSRRSPGDQYHGRSFCHVHS